MPPVRHRINNYACSETQGALVDGELLTRYQFYFKRSEFILEPDHYKEKLF